MSKFQITMYFVLLCSGIVRSQTNNAGYLEKIKEKWSVQLDSLGQLTSQRDCFFKIEATDIQAGIPQDTKDQLIFVQELDQLGYQLTNYGRGNWQHGPRIIHISMTNQHCSCMVEKRYYSTDVEDEFKIVESVNCE